MATLGALPEPRCLTRAAWDPVGQQLLVFGGQSNTAPFLGDFWTLDPALGVWTQRAYESMPGPRNFYAASFDDPARTWYLFGGSTADGKAGDVWAYDAAVDAWSALDTAGSLETPASRSNQDLAGFGSALYLFGGNDGVSDLNDLWALQLAIPEMPPDV